MKSSMILTEKERIRYSFRKGYGELKKGDVVRFRTECMRILNINNLTSFYQRMDAKIIPNILEYEQLLALFRKYGVNKPFGE